ncbi:MAG: hypothetical protein ABIR96_08110 [Bdellovibrionota bacterium]
MDLKSSYISGFGIRRDFVRVRGADALRFLQGMWTSDLKLAASYAPATTSSYLLNIKGRPVSPAQILCVDEKDFVLAVPEGWGPKVVEALDRYIVADDVELSLETRWKAWILIDDASVETSRLEARVQKDASKVFTASRLASDGWLLPEGRYSPEQLELWLTDESRLPNFAPLSSEEQTRLRIDAGLAEWAKDFSEESLILEYPFADEISFHKGCYIGQEVVARGTYRGQVPKVFARFQAAAALKEGGFVFRSDDPTKPIGKMTTVLGARALGQIRLRDIENATLVAELKEGGTAVLEKVDFLHSKVTE